MKEFIMKGVLYAIYLAVMTPICTIGILAGTWIFCEKILPKFDKTGE